MTTLRKPVRRVSNTALSADYGPDRGRRITITILPGNGRDVEDTLELRPLGTRRPEFITVLDAYRAALRGRVNKALLVKARDAKAKKADRLARRRREAAEKRLTP